MSLANPPMAFMRLSERVIVKQTPCNSDFMEEESWKGLSLTHTLEVSWSWSAFKPMRGCFSASTRVCAHYIPIYFQNLTGGFFLDSVGVH